MRGERARKIPEELLNAEMEMGSEHEKIDPKPSRQQTNDQPQWEVATPLVLRDGAPGALVKRRNSPLIFIFCVSAILVGQKSINERVKALDIEIADAIHRTSTLSEIRHSRLYEVRT